MLRHACLLLVALVAAAQATCIADKLGVYFSNTGSGSLSGVSASAEVTLPSLPICASAFTKAANGYTTCCSLDSFNAIKDFGKAFGDAIDLITNDYNAANFDQLAKAFSQVDTSNLPPNIRDFYNAIKGAYSDFIKNFFPHYGKCLKGYRDYLEGVLCSLCRTDFFDNVANISGNTLTFHFSQDTCTSLSSSCSQAVLDLHTFLVNFFAAYSQLTPGFTFDSDFLADVSGSTVSEQAANWLCLFRVSGIATIDLVALGDAFASIPQAGGKRDIDESANRFRSLSKKLASRQNPTTANLYTNDPNAYNPSQVGSSQNFVSGSAAATVVASVAVVAAAAIGIMLF